MLSVYRSRGSSLHVTYLIFGCVGRGKISHAQNFCRVLLLALVGEVGVALFHGHVLGACQATLHPGLEAGPALGCRIRLRRRERSGATGVWRNGEA